MKGVGVICCPMLPGDRKAKQPQEIPLLWALAHLQMALTPIVWLIAGSGYDFTGLLPERASASTSGAPPATSEAILPLVSKSTAIGVPFAPNILPTPKPWSSST